MGSFIYIHITPCNIKTSLWCHTIPQPIHHSSRGPNHSSPSNQISCLQQYFGVKLSFQTFLTGTVEFRNFGVLELNRFSKVFSQAYLREALLEQHMRSHRGVKPFVCNECGLQFTVKSNWQRHVSEHTGTRYEEKVICADYPSDVNLVFLL